MSASDGDMRGWLRENGHQPNARGKIRADLAEIYYAEFPDRRPAGSVALLPSPEEAWGLDGDFEEIGLAGPEPEREPVSGPRRYVAEPPGEPEAPTADSEPAHAGKEWRKGRQQQERRETPRRQGAPRKVSVTVRSDISAKISFALMVPGSIWKARDPLCGGTFVEQVPEMADAFTDIVCDSADLVAFFAGPGGNFMKALKVGAAVMPVIQMVAAHHVYHTIEGDQGDMTQPDYQDYAA